MRSCPPIRGQCLDGRSSNVLLKQRVPELSARGTGSWTPERRPGPERRSALLRSPVQPAVSTAPLRCGLRCKRYPLSMVTRPRRVVSCYGTNIGGVPECPPRRTTLTAAYIIIVNHAPVCLSARDSEMPATRQTLQKDLMLITSAIIIACTKIYFEDVRHDKI